MELMQRFAGETPIDTMVAVARSLAVGLRGAAVDLVETRHTTGSDLNCATTLFDAAWHADGVDLCARIENGGGNPRDGWGYEIDVDLRMQPGGALDEPFE